MNVFIVLLIIITGDFEIHCFGEKKIKRCILNNGLLKSTDINSFEEPDDIQQHYQYILSQTSQFRNFTIHLGPDKYPGPWIENYYISHFINKPISYFNGMIPLFIQWVDIHVYEMLTKRPKVKLIHVYRILGKILRRNVVYVTVSQDDEGIHSLQKRFPNILVLSAGGYGNIPIPLIKGQLVSSISQNQIINTSDQQKLLPIFKWDISFIGSRGTHQMRSEMIGELKCLAKSKNLSYIFEPNTEWKEQIKLTKFNLAPRGFGRTSFRLSEIIQLESIPVYIYDDIPWIPYKGSKVDLYNIGFVGQIGNLSILLDNMLSYTTNDIINLLKRVRNAREYYTYKGVIRQMELFFHDPLGPNGGYLKCQPLPLTVH